MNWLEESFWRRIQLAVAAWQMFKGSPLLGVGLGNFIPRLPQFLLFQKIYFWQPVHNLFLLILAETGLGGLFLAVYIFKLILRKLWRKKVWSLLFSFLVIFLTGLLDHYWLTLPQTQLLFSLIVGLGWSYYKKK